MEMSGGFCATIIARDRSRYRRGKKPHCFERKQDPRATQGLFRPGHNRSV